MGYSIKGSIGRHIYKPKMVWPRNTVLGFNKLIVEQFGERYSLSDYRRGWSLSKVLQMNYFIINHNKSKK